MRRVMIIASLLSMLVGCIDESGQTVSSDNNIRQEDPDNGANIYGDICNDASSTHEYSGITYHKARRNRLMIVDDSDKMIQVEVAGDDDQLEFLGIDRVIDININVPNDNKFDSEGIAWMYDDTYALLSEAVGIIFIVELPEGVTQIDNSHVIHTIDTDIREIRGHGAEGIAFDHSSAANADEQVNAVFYVTDEKPAAVYKVEWDGTVSSPIAISGITDASGIYMKDAPDGRDYIFIVSDESQTIVEAEINIGGTFGSLNLLSSWDISDEFDQAEGITFNRTMDEMIVIAENDGTDPACFGRWGS